MNEPAPKRQFSGRYALGVLLLVAMAFTVIMTFIGIRTTQRAAAKIGQRHEKRIDLAVTITQIRALNRLQTAQMQVTHVSKITQSYGVIPNALAGDELTFLAVGDVIAGIDLSRLKNDDVRVSGTTLIMTLPSPQILVTRIDNQRSRVIDRDTGVLRRADIDLESRARAGAEVAIRNEAVKRGILDLAEKNAQTHMAEFLRKAGFTSVRFEERRAAPPPAQR